MMVLVTGGASCGKSAFAEDVAMRLPGPHFYLAAMKPYGEEGARRVARHRALRAGKGFYTIECYDGLDCALDARPVLDEAAVPVGSAACASEVPCAVEAPMRGGTALLECLGNVVANELFASFEEGADAAVGHGSASVEELCSDMLGAIERLGGRFGDIVVVGNEVGADGIRYDGDTERYIRALGALSCELAARCDIVVEVTCGIAMPLKGKARLDALMKEGDAA